MEEVAQYEGRIASKEPKHAFRLPDDHNAVHEATIEGRDKGHVETGLYVID